VHPVLANRRLLALYLAAWLPLGGLLAAAFAEHAGFPWRDALIVALPLALVHAFVSLATWYVCRALPLRREHVPRLVVAHAGAAAVSSALWLQLGRAWIALLQPLPILHDPADSKSPFLFFVGMLVFLFAAVVHYLVIAFETSRQAERTRLELAVLARDAELRALRTQIDPHFLFNSLNSISALVSADPARARQMCVLLSELLRNSLRLGTQASISLAEELSLVEQYLAVERLRFGARLRTEIVVAAGLEARRLPPLLLQPLVENSITPGIAHLVDGGDVRVEARANGAFLHVRVENSYDPTTPRRSGTGTGIENVRQRLRLGYGGRASLAVQADGERFRVEVTLPLEAA
jgi:hypothetical protein